MFSKIKKFMLIVLSIIMLSQNLIYAGKIEFKIDGIVYVLDDSKVNFSIPSRIISIQDKCMLAYTICSYFEMRIDKEKKSCDVQNLLHTEEMSNMIQLTQQADEFILMSTRTARHLVTEIQNNIRYYRNALNIYSQALLICNMIIHNSTDKKHLYLLDLFKNYYMAEIKYCNLCIERSKILLEACNNSN